MTQRVGAVYTLQDKQVHLQRLIEPAPDADPLTSLSLPDSTTLAVLYNPNNLGVGEYIFVIQCRNFAGILEKMVAVNATLATLGRIV